MYFILYNIQRAALIPPHTAATPYNAGTMPEMLLNVIREEVARSEGQKWRRCIERVSV